MSLSKKYNKLRKRKRRLYFHNLLQSLDLLQSTNPKEYWNIINSIKRESASECASNIEPNTWKKYFESLSSVPEKHKEKVDLMKSMLRDFPLPPPSEVLYKYISSKEILSACKTLCNGKSSGSDSILNEMLKYGAFYILPCFEKLFNFVLNTGEYPSSWSDGVIIPLFKSGNPDDPNNYRGITITSCLAKLFNSILNRKLVKFLDDHKSLHYEQIGFRLGCRASDHIFKLKTIICKQFSKSKKLYTCFIDLKKAFDSVLHEALFIKLVKYGIGGKFLSVLKPCIQ